MSGDAFDGGDRGVGERIKKLSGVWFDSRPVPPPPPPLPPAGWVAKKKDKLPTPPPPERVVVDPSIYGPLMWSWGDPREPDKETAVAVELEKMTGLSLRELAEEREDAALAFFAEPDVKKKTKKRRGGGDKKKDKKGGPIAITWEPSSDDDEYNDHYFPERKEKYTGQPDYEYGAVLPTDAVTVWKKDGLGSEYTCVKFYEYVQNNKKWLRRTDVFYYQFTPNRWMDDEHHNYFVGTIVSDASKEVEYFVDSENDGDAWSVAVRYKTA